MRDHALLGNRVVSLVHTSVPALRERKGQTVWKQRNPGKISLWYLGSSEILNQYTRTWKIQRQKRFSRRLIKLPGGIIAHLEFKFNNSVVESYVSELLTQAANDGKLGSLEVEEVVVRKTFPGEQ